MSNEPAKEIPSTIGRYEIERHEAEGGMGDVFLARDPLMKRKVAVKLLKRLFVDDPSIRRRFMQEAEAVAGLEHPAIVPIYDFGEHQGQQYFVMRYVAGGTLKDKLADKPMPLREAAKVIERVAAALAAAHERRLVHRDIKPANILFDPDGTAYLSDFGIAKTHEPIDETGTMLLGTPQYLSPEQAQGHELDGRSDVYSLGVVAYHALAGRPPFIGKTPMVVAMGHVMEEPPPIRSLVPDLPPVVDKVFARVLAKDPVERYPSAPDFARDLSDIASGRWYLVKLSAAASTSETRPPPMQPAKPSRSGDTGEFFAAGTKPFEQATRQIRRVRKPDEAETRDTDDDPKKGES